MAMKPIQMLPMTKLTSDSLESVRNASLLGAMGAGETLQSFMNIRMIEETNALVSENAALKERIAALEKAIAKPADSTPEPLLTKAVLHEVLTENTKQLVEQLARIEDKVQAIETQIANSTTKPKTP